MLTYVINTSENKTFDSDELFKLVGYNKICWMNYGLNELEKCAAEICEKQTVLGADDFCIAILVDFYGFDRVRSAYGSKGYSPIEFGVDLSVYFPFLEAYMVDHLFSKIQRKNLIVREKHVFYIQDGQNDGFNVLDNKEEQIKYILEPEESSVTEVFTVKVARSELENRKKEQAEREYYSRQLTEEERQAVAFEYDSKIKEFDTLSEAELTKRQLEKNKKIQQELEEEDIRENTPTEEVYLDIPDKRYSHFKLYCTKSLSLDFDITDYPYTNKKGLSFHEFFMAFKQRDSLYNGIDRHHYYASFGSGEANAAFDNLSLSLYLIKLYEREERIKEKQDFIIERIVPDKLKDLLITAWNKICSAKTIALNNSSEYYDIMSLAEQKIDHEKQTRQAKAFSLMDSKSKARDALKELSAEKIFREILMITSESADSFSERDKKELDALMKNYLKERDNTKEYAVEYEFDAIKENCKITNQCPSRYDYENVIEKKKKSIAELLSRIVEIEYINKDYAEQKEKAEKSYAEYKAAKSCLGKSLAGDIALWVFSLIIMLVPFIAIKGWTFETISIYILTAGLFTGLFVIAFLIRIIPLIMKLNRAKRQLKECYLDCRVKQDMAMFNYKRRYEVELIKIETLRYELRYITRLYKYNLAKNRNIEKHRDKLELVETKLSAMLNNLGVKPQVKRYKNLSDEFDVNKSFMSNDNKIYKIFSIEAIEGLFGAKER